ncbi:hypothetical protein ACLKA6_018822 [Drosophila palustris]
MDRLIRPPLLRYHCAPALDISMEPSGRSGTVADLRARVAEFVSISTHAEHVSERLVELEQQYRDASGSDHSDPKSRSRSVSPVPRDQVVPQVIVTPPGGQPPELRTSGRPIRGIRNHSPSTQSTGRAKAPYRTIAERVHRWGIHFDGQSDPLSFIERELDRAYKNLLPDYQLYICRHEAHSLAQLTQLATDFKFVRDRERQRSEPAQLALAIAHNRDEPAVANRHRNPFRDNQPSTHLLGGEPPVSRIMQESGPAIDVLRACRRCGEIGHQARECRNRQLYYCWRCGKRGIRTTECCGLASGNGPRLHLPQDQKARIVARVKIEVQVRRVTLDTGATRNFISESAAGQLGLSQLRDVRAKVSMADGSRATVCKALVATVQLGEKCACIPFLVLSTVVDVVILGIDFLCAIRASLHCGPAQLQLTPTCLQTPAGRRNTIRAILASQDPLPGWETTWGGTIDPLVTHAHTANDAITTSQKLVSPDPKAGTPRNVYKDPSGVNPTQGNQDPKAGTSRKAHQDPKAGTPRNVIKDDAPTTPAQDDEQQHETKATEETCSTGASLWGPLEDGEPPQRPEVCAIAIPPEPDPHGNDADDDGPSD